MSFNLRVKTREALPVFNGMLWFWSYM